MNGIIINDELHELALVKTTSPCNNCSMRKICDCIGDLLLCDTISGRQNAEEIFVNRGNVKEFIEKLNS